MTTVTLASSKPPITLTSGRGITITIDRSVSTSSGGGSGTVTSVTGSAPVVITGTATVTPNVTVTAVSTVADGVMSSADKVKLDGIGTGATVTGVTGTLPISSSGGAAPVISIAAATTSAAGSMSSADKTLLNTLNDGYKVISKTTFGSPTASVDVNPAGYTAVKIVVLGKGDNAATSVGVRMRINNSSAAEYLINNTTTPQSSFNNNGNLPGSLTNSDRQGYWECDLAVGGTSKYTAGLQRGASMLSTGTTGIAPTSNALFFTGVTTSITSITVFPSAGNFDTGSQVTVLGLT
jgi:hypothetical protein